METALRVLHKTTEHLAEIGQMWFLRIGEGKNRSYFRSPCAAQSHMFASVKCEKRVDNMMTTASVNRLDDPRRKLLSARSPFKIKS